jgi:magnesium transporter
MVPDDLNQPLSAYLHRDFTTLNVNQCVAEALDTLRSTLVAEKIVYFYVIDAENHLLGVVPTRRLLMSPVETRLRDIMVSNVISIPLSMSVLDACEFFVMHRLLAFPVVDADNHLIGVVDVSLFTDEIFGVTEKQTAEDVFQLIGLRVAQARRVSPFTDFKHRFPWLLCNIAGGLACAFIAGHYEAFLDTVIVLALFIPIVLALSESVSMQSMSITVQSLRDTHVNVAQLLRALRIEVVTAILLGLACGGVVGAVALAWQRQGTVALAIGASIALAILSACLLGVLIPTAIRALKVDPRIAAGPVVLAVADICTLLFYFTLSARLLL